MFNSSSKTLKKFDSMPVSVGEFTQLVQLFVMVEHENSIKKLVGEVVDLKRLIALAGKRLANDLESDD